MADSDKLATVKDYIKRREAAEVDGILNICTDNIHFEDASGYHYKGQAEFGNYLKDPPPPSRWEEPAVQPDGTVLVLGEAQKMYMWWKIQATFTLSGNKIDNIKLARR